MKPLYWTRIQVPSTIPQVASPEEVDSGGEEKLSPTCLWEKIDEDSEVKQSMISKFAEIFSRPQLMKKTGTSIGKPKSKSHKAAANILDEKRAHNLNIIINSLHLDIGEIESAVYNMDTTNISIDVLVKIKDEMATSDELKKIKSHLEKKNQEVPLGKPEQFLYELSQINGFLDRVACIMFEIHFMETISVIETKLNNFRFCCDNLINSDTIPQVFSIILTLGNYMNGGNRERGQADGFGLEILPKIKDVKGSEARTPTLLHYIVQVYIDKYMAANNLNKYADSDIPVPIPEPRDLEKAALVDFDEIDADLQKLEKEIKESEKRIKKVVTQEEERIKKREKRKKKDGEEDEEDSEEDHIEPFKSRMESFISRAAKFHKDQVQNMKQSKCRFPEAMEFYTYRPKSKAHTDQVKEFFGNWIPFCSDFKDILKNEKAYRLREE